jgi:hypothetical protein
VRRRIDRSEQPSAQALEQSICDYNHEEGQQRPSNNQTLGTRQPIPYKRRLIRVNMHRQIHGNTTASTFYAPEAYQDLKKSRKGLVLTQQSALIGDEASCGVDRRRLNVVVFEHAIHPRVDEPPEAAKIVSIKLSLHLPCASMLPNL